MRPSLRITCSLLLLPNTILSLVSLKFNRVNNNVDHGFRYDPRHSSELLWMSASSTEDLSTEEKNSLFVDRAPCYDGLCTSSPKEKDAMGEATLRLGGPSVGPTVWSEFGRMASANSSIANLGQGFPDWLPPKFALDSLVEAAMDGAQSPHQYTRTAGHPNLVRQLAKRYSSHLNREIDPMAEVAVTVGASQALYLALQTHIKPGDEVILFEPFFDLYVNQVKLAGGTPIYVPLTFITYEAERPGVTVGGEWILDPSKLKEAISARTRAIVLNSPHNPTGKIFTMTEMEHIASALKNLAPPDCIVLSDEVYKYIVHSPPKEERPISVTCEVTPTKEQSAPSCSGHVHFASLPGMWERTITISSAGKTFSATGWQVGWSIGPPHLIAPIHQLLPYVQFCASTVIQEALARALPRADLPYEGYATYYDYLKVKYIRKRDLLARALQTAGFGVPDYKRTPGGGFFIFARIGESVSKALPVDRVNVINPAAPGGLARKDWALCQWMAEEKGVLCIPASPFFSRMRSLQGISDDFIRIAFCKSDETIDAAAAAFLSLHESEKSSNPIYRKSDLASITNSTMESPYVMEAKRK